MDNEKVKKETAKYKPIPTIMDFTGMQGEDTMEQEIHANYNQVKQDVINIVSLEMERIKSDPGLAHLVKEKE